MVIEPIFERGFAGQSYGFRPGRGCKDALRRVDELLKSGLTHVVDVDIKGYFDSIPHERLMALVRERIADSRVLKLIESFLKQRIMDPMGWIDPEEHDEGTPQGGVICQHFRRDHGWLSPLIPPLWGSLSAVCLAALGCRYGATQSLL